MPHLDAGIGVPVIGAIARPATWTIAALLRTLLEAHHRVTTRHTRRRKTAEVLTPGPLIEQPVPHERHKRLEFPRAQVDRSCQERVDALEYRLDGSQAMGEVPVDARGDRVVAARRLVHVQVVADRVLESRERAVVEERRLQGDVAQRRGPEFVSIRRIPGDLLQAEILVPPWPVEYHVARSGAKDRSDLRDADDVHLEVAEHLRRTRPKRRGRTSSGRDRRRPGLLLSAGPSSL